MKGEREDLREFDRWLRKEFGRIDKMLAKSPPRNDPHRQGGG